MIWETFVATSMRKTREKYLILREPFAARHQQKRSKKKQKMQRRCRQIAAKEGNNCGSPATRYARPRHQQHQQQQQHRN